jgi:hypothetical protein
VRSRIAPKAAKRVKAPLSTVARYVQRLGLNRLEVLDPKPAVQRYEHERPGELVQPNASSRRR